jgi:hypothetical protein
MAVPTIGLISHGHVSPVIAKATTVRKLVMTAHRQYQQTGMPSQETEQYWIGAVNPNDQGGEKPYSGKWLLYISVSELDSTWLKIKTATENGSLGTSAKSATMRDNPNATVKSKVICIYTKDCRDMEDVQRVLKALRDMGFLGRLYYKEDLATIMGNYRHGKASLYESSVGMDIRQRRPVTEIPGDLIDAVNEHGIEILKWIRLSGYAYPIAHCITAARGVTSNACGGLSLRVRSLQSHAYAEYRHRIA